MKITEMTTDQATEAMIRLSGPFSEICDDDEALAIVDEYKKRMRMPMFYMLGHIMPRLITHLLVKHRAAVYEILAVLLDKPVEKIGKMKLTETVRLAKESYDEVLESFFTSSGTTAESQGKESV